ncbi:MAG: hypothetical protein PHP07_08240 [Eubacteriales bacterium]|jgi:hypothetical protein|nr:hypothetical protein [Eubacteriales bacterium]MDD3572916.1 hypothetical protein [Eubacteriales bacterium]MDD4135276.1 hypothetical protein [Eubacteriales bacterium]NLO13757.1 hypothetical protein [Clostridiales bacterium]
MAEKKKKEPSRAQVIITKIAKVLGLIWLLAIIAFLLFGKFAEALALLFPALLLLAFMSPMTAKDYLFLIWWDKGGKK